MMLKRSDESEDPYLILYLCRMILHGANLEEISEKLIGNRHMRAQYSEMCLPLYLRRIKGLRV